MNARDFKRLLKEVGFSQLHTADVFKKDARTVRRWCEGVTKVPTNTAAMLTLLRAGRITEAEIRESVR